MTGFWLLSYLLLWAVVALLCFLVLGMLRQIGELRLQRLAGEAPRIPDIEHDGPAIGSPVLDLILESFNGFGSIDLKTWGNGVCRLLVFLSPTCEGCQHAVEPLNKLAGEMSDSLRICVIMRGDEHACEAFFSVFPLHVPLVCDAKRTITPTFDAHRNPFGLLYNVRGVLVRKGTLEGGHDDLLALLGKKRADPAGDGRIYPPLEVADVTER